MGKYFTMSEMTHSDTAIASGIDNEPDCSVRDNIDQLISVLDKMREGWGEVCQSNNYGSGAVRVNSGYRCPALNSKVGGASTSGHLSGFAADLWPMNGRFKEFKSFVLDYFRDAKYDELIVETNSKGSQWIHFSLFSVRGEQRQKTFTDYKVK